MAQAELADSGAGLALAILYGLAALLVGILALAIGLAGVALALAMILPLWLAFLAVGAAAMVVALGLLLMARRQRRRCVLLPRRALASLRQNVSDLAGEWLLTGRRRRGSLRLKPRSPRRGAVSTWPYAQPAASWRCRAPPCDDT